MTAQEQTIVDRWNTLAEQLGLAKIIRVTKTREKQLKQRLQEEEWDLNKIEDGIRASNFLQGRNDRGWKVNFDFIINASGYVKILEGRYTNGRRTQGIQASPQKYEGLAV
jgi:hypothetical protein